MIVKKVNVYPDNSSRFCYLFSWYTYAFSTLGMQLRFKHWYNVGVVRHRSFHCTA